MQRAAAFIALCLALIFGFDTPRAHGQCKGVNRGLSAERKAALSPEIARQLGVKHVDLLKSFQFGDWNIYYVDTYQTDEAYVFYKRDPLQSHYVTLWSGAAREEEEGAIESWTIKNAPGIPGPLASCFAWHVTKER